MTGRSRLRRAIATAAILVAAVIIAGIQYLHPTEPTAAVGPDAPPQGVPLFYFADGGHHHALVAYDWSGRRRGSITLPPWVDLSRLRMAPDGSSFVIDPAFGGDWLGYFDRLGNTVMETDNTTSDPSVWADDNRHLCALAGADVVVRLPGSPDRSIRLPAHVYNTTGDLGLLACSARSDAALLASVGGAEITLTRVKLSTGKTLNEGSFAGDANMVVSDDTTLVAVGHAPSGLIAVYRATDLTRRVGEVTSSATPIALSGDGRSLLVLDGAGMELVDWRSGRQLWRLEQSPGYSGSALARPSSSDFAFAISNGKGSATGIFIVHHDGTTTDLDHGIPVTW